MARQSRREFMKGVGAAAVAGGALTGAPALARNAPQEGVKIPLPKLPTAPDDRRKVTPGSPYPTFSRAVGFEQLIFVAGVVGQKPGTRDLVSPDFEPQCRQSLENLKASVEAAGSTLDRVLKCTVYITDAADFGTFNKIYTEYFPKDPPARSSVVVKELVVPGAKLEVDCVTFAAAGIRIEMK